jgi:hypothetical protein
VAEASGEVIGVLNNSTDTGVFETLTITLSASSIGTRDVLPIGTIANLDTLTINGAAVP